jgi:plastocyanin
VAADASFVPAHAHPLQATTVHVVTVSSSSATLTYTPNNLTAAVGDMVQFQFAAGNHTVTQSTFDEPCQPIAKNSNVTGFFSGFQLVTAGSTNVPTYTIEINSTTPIWVYCSQASHCQKGMNLVINEKYANPFPTLV